ncbi:hypothetical protein [Peptostreptococcus canis]|uniref:Uncharacterized protein n=1 Tax=Peptostreptococcus canis TaxID=1159213 RepID=A0ABR6TJA3_9FIRM|nr:hypothetical protein [Peptostreptococcus canis]MBC2575480.1 hypothetical protein [Peptostreptococcus canis]MBP1997328.1 hypothetical protein [Peptostreptococcus canis]
MMDVYNDEKILMSFETHRKLNMTNKGTNMVANCLLGHSKSSGIVPDLYTLILTEKTFFAEYSRKSLHGSKPKKVTKLNIPIEDIVKFELAKKDEDDCLYLKSEWGKEYYFEIDNTEKKLIALKMIEEVEKINKK